MDRRSALFALIASAGAVVVGSAANFEGFRWRLPVKEGRKSLLIGGAGAMVPLNQALADAFIKLNTMVDVVIEKGGSLQGLIAARRGAIDLAAMTRDLSNEEDDASAHDFLIARGDIRIIVNKASFIKTLTQKQIRGLLTGEMTNWKQVGGIDAPVNVISRAKGSTTRQFVEEVVLDGGEVTSSAKEMETTKLLAASVAADPCAIGYVASKDSEGIADVTALAVDGVAASRATVLSGRYPYTHSFSLLIYGEQKGLRLDFVNFARSAAGQKIVAQNGLIPVC
jgi:phosphate transport system substrate-binding protein